MVAVAALVAVDLGCIRPARAYSHCLDGPEWMAGIGASAFNAHHV